MERRQWIFRRSLFCILVNGNVAFKNFWFSFFFFSSRGGAIFLIWYLERILSSQLSLDLSPFDGSNLFLCVFPFSSRLQGDLPFFHLHFTKSDFNLSSNLSVLTNQKSYWIRNNQNGGWKWNGNPYNIHHHHHIVLVARISLTLSRHSSLSFIALGRSSGQHPVSSHSCWMYVRAGRPAFARPCVGIHTCQLREKGTHC